ncbi:fructuronate reductase, partial [Yersinia pestis]
GSQKLPQRMLDSVRWHLKQGNAYPCLALGIAGWMRYVGGIDDNGQVIDIRDPMVDSFKQCVAASEDGAARVQSLLRL